MKLALARLALVLTLATAFKKVSKGNQQDVSLSRSLSNTTPTTQVSSYQRTQGACRSGPAWDTGELWDCSPGSRTDSECAAACNANTECGAYDFPDTPGTGVCCLFKPGQSGDGQSVRVCMIKATFVIGTKTACPDGYTQIVTVTECQEAAPFLSVNYGSEGTWGNNIYGCFQHGNLLYFDHATTQTPDSDEKMVCKQTATTTTTTTTMAQSGSGWHDHCYIHGNDVPDTNANNANSQEQCKSACDANLACKSAIFGNSCHLKDTGDMSLCQWSATISIYVKPTTQAPTFLGCFKDAASRAFDGGYNRVGKDASTVIDCMAVCQGTQYMAIQDGDACFCGDTYQTGGNYTQVGDSECSYNLQCSVSNGCGGYWRNSIYRIGQTATTTTTTTTMAKCPSGWSSIGGNCYSPVQLTIGQASDHTGTHCSQTDSGAAGNCCGSQTCDAFAKQDCYANSSVLMTKNEAQAWRAAGNTPPINFGLTSTMLGDRNWIDGYDQYGCCDSNRWYVCVKATVTIDVVLVGDYNTVVGNNKTLFLERCSLKFNNTVRCVNVRPGSIVVALSSTGLTPEQANATVSSAKDDIQTNGLVLTGFGKLAVQESYTLKWAAHGDEAFNQSGEIQYEGPSGSEFYVGDFRTDGCISPSDALVGWVKEKTEYCFKSHGLSTLVARRTNSTDIVGVLNCCNNQGRLLEVSGSGTIKNFTSNGGQ